KVLVVLAGPDDDTERSFRNLPNVKLDYPGNLSTYDLLYADRVLFTGSALDVITGQEFELAASTDEDGDSDPADGGADDQAASEEAAEDPDATEDDQGVEG